MLLASPSQFTFWLLLRTVILHIILLLIIAETKILEFILGHQIAGGKRVRFKQRDPRNSLLVLTCPSGKSNKTLLNFCTRDHSFPSPFSCKQGSWS